MTGNESVNTTGSKELNSLLSALGFSCLKASQFEMVNVVLMKYRDRDGLLNIRLLQLILSRLPMQQPLCHYLFQKIIVVFCGAL